MKPIDRKAELMLAAHRHKKVFLWVGLVFTLNQGVFAAAPIVFGGSMKSFRSSANEVNTVKKVVTKMIYPKAGQILMSAPRFCGDSYAATYYATNPLEQHANGALTVKVVAGYWVVPQGADPVPKMSDWFAVGYNTLTVDGYSSKLIRANDTTEFEFGSLYREEMADVLSQIKTSSAKTTATKFDIYSATMICNNYVNSSGVPAAPESPIYPTAAKIAGGLISVLSSANVHADALTTYPLTADIRLVDAKITAQVPGTTAINNDYAQVASAIHGLSYPADASTIDALLAPKGNSLIDTCSATLATGGLKLYWWESVPLQLTCQALQVPLTQSAIAALKAGGMTQTQFDTQKALLERGFKQAAILEHLQKIVNEDANYSSRKNKIACFPDISLPDAPYFINTVLASVGFPFKVIGSATANPVVYDVADFPEMTHPDPDYANPVYSAPYKVNQKALFMVDGVTPMTVQGGLNYEVYSRLTLDLSLHVRDVGCTSSSGRYYCQAPTRHNEMRQ